DGATSTTPFHEGLNFAAVMKLPLIVIAENNGWAYSTPINKQMSIRDIADRARGYGIPGKIVEGNDVLAVFSATREAADRARRGEGPTLIEANTMRMKGHAERDDARYVPPELRESWRRNDRVAGFEAF